MNEPTIIRKDVKENSITVRPTGEVVVTVALDSSQAEIDSLLSRRSGWIAKQIAFFAEYRPVVMQWISGETIKYLGRQYRLKIIKNEQETKVRLIGKYLQVHLVDTDNTEKKQRMVEEWYKVKAEVYMRKIVTHYETIVGHTVKSLRIRKMKTRWGSCNPKRSFINLNADLIQAPKIAIEYVVLHELAHLVHPDHSAGFYSYLSVHMPDWKHRKQVLEDSRLM